jgi:hypothetical protein
MLTTYGKELMGFKPIPDGTAIRARFHAVHVLTIQGVTLDASTIAKVQGTVQGTSYSLAVGSNLNAIARLLLDEDYVDDEAAWAETHACAPPYALLHLGPTGLHHCQSGHAQEHEGAILTYDAFSSAKQELRDAADRVLPSVITGLASALWSPQHPVRVVTAAATVFGRTDTGSTLHDIRLTLSATLAVASRLESQTLTDRVSRATDLASAINPKVARFYRLGVEEKDPLKQFLYFFLAIEVTTHATFASIDHSSAFGSLVVADERTRDLVLPFLEEQRLQWKTLRQRFVWCVACRWTHLSRADVDEFLRLKGVRDAIAHGVIASPSGPDVLAVARLATLLQQTA